MMRFTVRANGSWSHGTAASTCSYAIGGKVRIRLSELLSRFQSVSFRHVKRALNETAHRLAKSSEDVNSSFIFRSVPDFIRRTLCIGVL
jgi:hypothetical protein